MRYFDDLTEADTAAALGISVGTVKSHARGALARLSNQQSGEEHSRFVARPPFICCRRFGLSLLLGRDRVRYELWPRPRLRGGDRLVVDVELGDALAVHRSCETDVGAVAADGRVASLCTHCVRGGANQEVVPAAALEAVIPLVAEDAVVPVAAHQHVVVR